MSVTVKTINGSEPITVSEAKDHCYVAGSQWDSLISSLITVAREYAENRTWRAIIDATYEMNLDEFPDGAIALPKPPIRTVDSIEYVDTDGNTQTLSSSEYEADVSGEYGRVRMKKGKSWPATDDVYNGVTITFTAGYDGSSAKYTLPTQIEQGMKLMIKHLFDNRESVIMSEGNNIDVKEVPMTTKHLLDMYSARVYT